MQDVYWVILNTKLNAKRSIGHKVQTLMFHADEVAGTVNNGTEHTHSCSFKYQFGFNLTFFIT
jgi:hypothetical protein